MFFFQQWCCCWSNITPRRSAELNHMDADLHTMEGAFSHKALAPMSKARLGKYPICNFLCMGVGTLEWWNDTFVLVQWHVTPPFTFPGLSHTPDHCAKHTKQLDFDRAKTTAAISIGSLISMGMYMTWCYTAFGGGLDGTTPVAPSLPPSRQQPFHFNGNGAFITPFLYNLLPMIVYRSMRQYQLQDLAISSISSLP
jgi:hypothetical protein